MPRLCVSQIYLTDAEETRLPERLEEAVATVRATLHEHPHVLYGKASLRAWIAAHMDADVLWAYDALAPYAYKADLARYCLLHRQGGWYVDVSIRFRERPRLPRDTQLCAFRDMQRNSRTSWACSTSVLFAEPGLPLFRYAIERIVENCRSRYYGLTPLCPTGPTVLGQALARHGADERHVIGDVLELTPAHLRKNAAFVMSDGRIIAFGKEAEGGDLTALGARGVNDYNVFWRERRVYLP